MGGAARTPAGAAVLRRRLHLDRAVARAHRLRGSVRRADRGELSLRLPAGRGGAARGRRWTRGGGALARPRPGTRPVRRHPPAGLAGRQRRRAARRPLRAERLRSRVAHALRRVHPRHLHQLPRDVRPHAGRGPRLRARGAGRRHHLGRVARPRPGRRPGRARSRSSQRARAPSPCAPARAGVRECHGRGVARRPGVRAGEVDARRLLGRDRLAAAGRGDGGHPSGRAARCTADDRGRPPGGHAGRPLRRAVDRGDRDRGLRRARAARASRSGWRWCSSVSGSCPRSTRRSRCW